MKNLIKQILREALIKEYYEDEDEDSYDDSSEEYFTPKLTNAIKKLSQPFHGRNVIWYGTPGKMVYLTRDEVEGMFGNIYNEDKLASLTKLILNYPDKVEIECSYGHSSVITILPIKEEQESYQSGRFEIDYDGTDEPATTGSKELDEYVGKDLDDMYWYDLDWGSDDVDNQDAMAVFFEKNKFALVEGKSIEELIREFNNFNPTQIQIDCFKEFIKMNKELLEAENNNEGDFNKFKVQLRDGHHRVFAAFDAGEKYVCVDLIDEDLIKYKGYYNLVK